MRTTLTLEPDVAQKLKARVAEERITFKRAVNEALREGLRARPQKRRKPFRVEPFSLGLRPGIDPHKLNQLADELETQAMVDSLLRARKRRRPA